MVRTGSRNEVEPGFSGYAHFFEHMMFRGTAKYPTDAYNDVIKRLGADSNAFTTDDWTTYHTVASADALETIIDLESDRFLNQSQFKRLRDEERNRQIYRRVQELRQDVQFLSNKKINEMTAEEFGLSSGAVQKIFDRFSADLHKSNK